MNTTSRFIVVALLIAGTAFLTQARSSNEVFPPRDPLTSLPSQFGPWAGRDLTLDQQTRDILGNGEFLERAYENTDDRQPWVDLLVAYFPSQKAGDTIHSPNHCLQGAGWIPVQRTEITVQRPDGSSFPANRYVITKAGERELVIYWFEAHGRAVANEYRSKYYLIKDAVLMNRSDGALVRLITPMHGGESADAAQARLMAFGANLLPELPRVIPR